MRVPITHAPVSLCAPEGTTMKTEGRYINTYKAFVGSMVPNWLLSRTEVSHGAKLAYARLAQYAGDNMVAYPKRVTLAAELGVSARQLDRYLTELETKHELIEVEQLGLRRANRYRFLRHPWMESANLTTPLKKEKRIIRRRTKKTVFQTYTEKMDSRYLEVVVSSADGGSVYESERHGSSRRYGRNGNNRCLATGDDSHCSDKRSDSFYWCQASLRSNSRQSMGTKNSEGCEGLWNHFGGSPKVHSRIEQTQAYPSFG